EQVAKAANDVHLSFAAIPDHGAWQRIAAYITERTEFAQRNVETLERQAGAGVRDQACELRPRAVGDGTIEISEGRECDHVRKEKPRLCEQPGLRAVSDDCGHPCHPNPCPCHHASHPTLRCRGGRGSCRGPASAWHPKQCGCAA